MSGRDIWIEKVREKDAEIERLKARNEFLEKVAEQFAKRTRVDREYKRVATIYADGDLRSLSIPYIGGNGGAQREYVPLMHIPELATWLKEKENAN